MAYKSLYTGQQIDAAIAVVTAKESVWDKKQDRIAGEAGQVIGFDKDGAPVAQDATGVSSFHGREGAVIPAAGDYTAEMVGALPDDTAIPSKTSELVNDAGFATSADVDARLAALVNAAPETLDTLDELAAALGDDPNFATTVATQIGGKVDKVEGKQLSANDYTDEDKAKVQSALQSFSEADPTVPAWAKESSKPSYQAEEIGFDPQVVGMSATNMQEAVAELFTSVSNGKAAVASAITDKGVQTESDAAYAQMAAHIRAIETSVAPTVTVDGNGLITAACKDKVTTQQLPIQDGQQITPGTAARTAVSAGRYTTGDIVVAGDSNLTAENIKRGVSLFGVAGAYGAPHMVPLTGKMWAKYTFTNLFYVDGQLKDQQSVTAYGLLLPDGIALSQVVSGYINPYFIAASVTHYTPVSWSLNPTAEVPGFFFCYPGAEIVNDISYSWRYSVSLWPVTNSSISITTESGALLTSEYSGLPEGVMVLPNTIPTTFAINTASDEVIGYLNYI